MMYALSYPWKQLNLPPSSKDAVFDEDRVVDEPSEFASYVKSLFDVFDTEKKGYATVYELEKYFAYADTSGGFPQWLISSKLISILHQICPSNGLINFKRFHLAIQIALGKTPLDRKRGIGRSLRPRSFLFAVTDSRECTQVHDESLKICSSKEIYGDTECANSIESTLRNDELPEAAMLQKCLAEANKVKEMYSLRIMDLQQQNPESPKIESGIVKEDKNYNRAYFDYSHIGLHISNIWRMNETLQQSQFQTQENKDEMKDLSSHIRLLESTKTSLVKDLFGRKAKLSNDTQEENVPF